MPFGKPTSSKISNNAINPTFNETPWGGYKMSGWGRELNVHVLEEYQEVKQIN